MHKLLLIVGLLLCAGIMSSQGNKNATQSQQPATQDQPAIHKANSQNDQANPGDKKSQSSKGAPAGNTSFEGSKVWWQDSNWWLVIIAALTGAAIVWQAVETHHAAKGAKDAAEAALAQSGHLEEQTKILKDSVVAAQKSADAAEKSAGANLLQIRMLKDKERARVEVKSVGLEVEHHGDEFWNLKAGIELRNLGENKAFVRQGTGRLWVGTQPEDDPSENYWGPLNIVDSFIDPGGLPITEPFFFFETDSLDLPEFARKVCDGDLPITLRGFIEYETVGTRFHRDFEYVWVGHASPLNIGAMLTFSGEFKPTNDSERISYGFWQQQLFGKNEEYEVEPQNQS